MLIKSGSEALPNVPYTMFSSSLNFSLVPEFIITPKYIYLIFTLTSTTAYFSHSLAEDSVLNRALQQGGNGCVCFVLGRLLLKVKYAPSCAKIEVPV